MPEQPINENHPANPYQVEAIDLCAQFNRQLEEWWHQNGMKERLISVNGCAMFYQNMFNIMNGWLIAKYGLNEALKIVKENITNEHLHFRENREKLVHPVKGWKGGI